MRSRLAFLVGRWPGMKSPSSSRRRLPSGASASSAEMLSSSPAWKEWEGGNEIKRAEETYVAAAGALLGGHLLGVHALDEPLLLLGGEATGRAATRGGSGSLAGSLAKT